MNRRKGKQVIYKVMTHDHEQVRKQGFFRKCVRLYIIDGVPVGEDGFIFCGGATAKEHGGDYLSIASKRPRVAMRAVKQINTSKPE